MVFSGRQSPCNHFGHEFAATALKSLLATEMVTRRSVTITLVTRTPNMSESMTIKVKNLSFCHTLIMETEATWEAAKHSQRQPNYKGYRIRH